MDPLLRFIHDAGIQPCSWCRVENLTEYHVGQAVRTQIEGHCHIRQLGSLDSEDMPKILLVGWDIECDSSHGDMPQAIKSFSRPARELIQWIRRNIRLVTPDEFLTEFAAALRGEKTEHLSEM